MASDADVAMVQGGFQSLSKGLQPAVDNQLEEERKNKPASPIEKWAARVMAGQVSPEVGATHAKLEMQGMPEVAPLGINRLDGATPAYGPMNAPPPPSQQPPMPQAPPQQGLGVPPPPYGMGPPTQAQAPAFQNQQPIPYPSPQAPAPQQPPQSSGPLPTPSPRSLPRDAQGLAEEAQSIKSGNPGLFSGGRSASGPSSGGGGLSDMPEIKTVGDLETIMKLAPYLQKRGVTENDLLKELIKEQGKNSRAGDSLEVRQKEGAADRGNKVDVAKIGANTQTNAQKNQLQIERENNVAAMARTKANIASKLELVKHSGSDKEFYNNMHALEATLSDESKAVAQERSAMAGVAMSDEQKDRLTQRENDLALAQREYKKLLAARRNQPHQPDVPSTKTTITGKQSAPIGTSPVDLNELFRKK